MNEQPATRGPRRADAHARLRLAALTAVITGVVVLAAAAFVLSYPGIHDLALASGAPAALARLYPAIFDATLAIACAAALTLRGARWWTRCYVWLTLLALFAAVGAAGAVHAMGVALPARASAAATAVAPWALFLLGFGLWLAMARHLRRLRHASRLAPPTGGPVEDRPAQAAPVEAAPAQAAPAPGGVADIPPDLTAASAVTAPDEAGDTRPGQVGGLPHALAGDSPAEVGRSLAADAVAPAAGVPGPGSSPAGPGPGADGPASGAGGPRSTSPAGPSRETGAGQAEEVVERAPLPGGGQVPGDGEAPPGRADEQEAAASGRGPDDADAPQGGAPGGGTRGDLAAAGLVASEAPADGGPQPDADATPAAETGGGPQSDADATPAAQADGPASPAGTPFERVRSAPTPPDE